MRDHVADEEMFLANYSDGVTDLPLPDYIDAFRVVGWNICASDQAADGVR